MTGPVAAHPFYAKRKSPQSYTPSYFDQEFGNIQRGMLIAKVRTVTADAVVQASDDTIAVDTSTGPVTVTLPTPDKLLALRVTIKQANGSSDVTVSGVLEGTTSLVLSSPGQSVTLQSDGATWLWLDGILSPNGAVIPGEIGVVNLAWPPGWAPRYGATGDGVTDDAVAISNCIQSARLLGIDAFLPEVIRGSPYRCAQPMDITTANPGPFNTRYTRVIGISSRYPFQAHVLIDHGGVGFDCTGTQMMVWENVNFGAPLAGNVPLCGYLLARNASLGGAGLHRFVRCTSSGRFLYGQIYCFAAEEVVLEDCYFNSSTSSGTVVTLTGHNIRGLSSTFQTIATGAPSSIVFTVRGGTFQSEAGGSDIFYLDSFQNVRVDAAWLLSGDSASSGRSYCLVDLTNGPSNGCSFTRINGENGAHLPLYGIRFQGGTATCDGWEISGQFCTTTAFVSGAANATLADFTIHSMIDAGASPPTKWIDVDKLTSSVLTLPAGTIRVATTATGNEIHASMANISLPASSTNTIIDMATGKLLAQGGIGVGNSAAATTPGAVVKKIEVFDASGSSIGFLPVYSSIT